MSSSAPSAPSGAPSTTTEMAASIAAEESPSKPAAAPAFPPYPPYKKEPAPPSVANTITAGRDIRVQYKSVPQQKVRPPPKPAKPKGPKATDVKLSKRAAKRHARCLRLHGAILTDRLERMSKPPRRNIINLWREHAYTLAPETIYRLRSMLDADEPFKPDQAYEFFINMRKTKKKNATKRGVNQIKKDLLAICCDKKFIWARNATVAFAKGIQMRLTRPGHYVLADKMLRLSNIVLDDMCKYVHMKTPSRRSQHPKAKFMIEMADKITVWIDDVLAESEDRMLMMDFDEDDEVLQAEQGGGFTDNFLDMMGGGGGGSGWMGLLGPRPAYMKFSGPMMDAFIVLTNAMNDKGNAQLLSHGKFQQTYMEAATELKDTTTFDATEFDSVLATRLNKDLVETAQPTTPTNLVPYVKEVVNICANYLAQNAEYNRDKGPAFKLLVKTMNTRPKEQLYQKEKVSRTYGSAADDLNKAKGLESDHDDPNLSQEVHSLLSKLVAPVTTDDLKTDMQETLDVTSKYLSQAAVDEIERGPAFDMLIRELELDGAAEFAPQFDVIGTKYAAAYTLMSAPGLCSVAPDPKTAPIFKEILQLIGRLVAPPDLRDDMDAVVDRCSNYLSAFVRDRGRAMEILIKSMKGKGQQELVKRNAYSMDYATGVQETEKAPTIVPYLPVKDVANEVRDKLATDVASSTPGDLKTAMKSLVQDVGKHLSQTVALRSGIAGERYALNFLAAVKNSLGIRPLYKYKSYGQTYGDAAEELKYAGVLESEGANPELQEKIKEEMTQGIPTKLTQTVTQSMEPVITDASKHLAKVGAEKGLAMDHLVKTMREEGGEKPLEELQGYVQSYNFGASRIENTQSLKIDKVDKAAYESVKSKLNLLTEKNPDKTHAKHLPGLIEDSAKFLSAPAPENEMDKRRVLAAMMTSKGDQVLGEEGGYKMTYKEGGQELMKAPIGVTAAKDERRKTVMLQNITTAIPTEKMKETLKDPAHEGAAYLTDVISARGQAMKDGAGTGAGVAAAGTSKAASALAGDDEAARRRAEEEARRRAEEEACRRAEEEARRKAAAQGGETDADRAAAMGILHSQLKARGGENFYKQPNTQLSHSQASEWLQKPPMKVDKSIKESADTDRLQKKFERKLSAVVTKNTPTHMVDAMQDVVIESSRALSEYFVASNYKELAKVGLISEMQKRGNEILVENNGAAESFFFAAQRLKKAKTTEENDPHPTVAYHITKKLDDMTRSRSMPRKLTTTMKEHVKGTADFLSVLATKPDAHIEAYVALLNEMETNGDAPLIEGDIPISYKDAANYLRNLTTFDDVINMPNASMQSAAASKLKGIMANVTPAGYKSTDMDGVINENAKLLTSYIMLQGEKTKALKVLVEKMDAAGDNVLLRHGTLRKSFTDGANLLRDKTSDQLRVPNGDPVVARKVQIKLNNLMAGQTPEKMAALVEAVIEDATTYLAVHLVQPQFIQVCKCMKNVFVQCELWCDEILRRVGRPCCSCSRHVSAQALQDLAPGERIQVSPSASRAFAPGYEISLKTCASKIARTCIRRGEKPADCPASKPTECCKNEPATYLQYATTYDQPPHRRNPTFYSPDMPSSSRSHRRPSEDLSSLQSLLLDIYDKAEHAPPEPEEPEHENQGTSEESAEIYFTPPSTVDPNRSNSPYWSSPTTMYSEVISNKKSPGAKPFWKQQTSASFSSRTPIVTTDQMADWHAMMVSLMWNVQAWRDWIQDCVDRALSYKYEPNVSPMESEERWSKLRARITNEAYQWRQYNSFSRQLTVRLASRYENKQIVSPIRSTVKTDLYRECQLEMIDIINMFYRWTHWLNAVVKETDLLQQVTGSDVPIHVMRWNYFKAKVQEYAEDWKIYKTHLSVCWEHKYRSLITEWLPTWNQPGPVWVVSACGAVPSGAVAAGLCDGEVTWVARTTHKSQVLPAALYPSKRSCLVYAEGSIHQYTKYQVMCNAEVKWKPWKAGSATPDAVSVAPGVYIGRVHYRDSHLLGAVQAPYYRCHVVIFNRPFAFNCYELLVLDSNR